MMRWKDMPAGMYKGALDRLWVEFGDDSSAIATRINTDPEFLRRMVKYAKNRDVKKLLRFLSAFETKAMEEFVAGDWFIEGKITDGVTIYALCDKFKENLLGKVERDVKAAKLMIHEITSFMSARDLPEGDEPGLISELDGKHEIKLAHFFQLLAHKQREKNYTCVVAYICDVERRVWQVQADWWIFDKSFDGWFIIAESIGYLSSATSPGHEVVSC